MICQYSTLFNFYSKSCQIICLILLHFASFCFILLHFAWFYNLNHLFFDSFRFVSGYSLYIFDSVMNRITKTTIRPSLFHSLLVWIFVNSQIGKEPRGWQPQKSTHLDLRTPINFCRLLSTHVGRLL